MSAFIAGDISNIGCSVIKLYSILLTSMPTSSSPSPHPIIKKLAIKIARIKYLMFHLLIYYKHKTEINYKEKDYERKTLV